MSSLDRIIGQTFIAQTVGSDVCIAAGTASNTGKDGSFCAAVHVSSAYPLGDGIRAVETLSTAKVRPTLIQDSLHPGCYINRSWGLLPSEPRRPPSLEAFACNMH